MPSSPLPPFQPEGWMRAVEESRQLIAASRKLLAETENLRQSDYGPERREEMRSDELPEAPGPQEPQPPQT